MIYNSRILKPNGGGLKQSDWYIDLFERLREARTIYR